jgi:hypothetical protein
MARRRIRPRPWPRPKVCWPVTVKVRSTSGQDAGSSGHGLVQTRTAPCVRAFVRSCRTVPALTSGGGATMTRSIPSSSAATQRATVVPALTNASRDTSTETLAPPPRRGRSSEALPPSTRHRPSWPLRSASTATTPNPPPGTPPPRRSTPDGSSAASSGTTGGASGRAGRSPSNAVGAFDEPSQVPRAVPTPTSPIHLVQQLRQLPLSGAPAGGPGSEWAGSDTVVPPSWVPAASHPRDPQVAGRVRTWPTSAQSAVAARPVSSGNCHPCDRRLKSAAPGSDPPAGQG